ncbi:MAG: hypothetical protein N2248_00405 [candidate division WOR-3 bacterium]|nr:hypothetical protein [candidate division WOR-3 bacterium]
MKTSTRLLLLLLFATILFAQVFYPGTPIVAPKITSDTLVLHKKFVLISDSETLACWTSDSVLSAALIGNLLGTWKGKDTSYFAAYTRAHTWTGRQTFADLVTADSCIAATGVFSTTLTVGAGAPVKKIAYSTDSTKLYFIIGSDTFVATKKTE